MQVPPFSLDKQLVDIGPELESAVSRVLRSGKYIGGEEVKKFENSFAEAIGVSHAISCNSGTDALVLALRALDVGQGDEVITSSFSFFATAEAISAVGAKPVFVDIDENFLIDLTQLEKAITPLTKVILPVHLFGCPVNMTQLLKITKKYDLKIIEDCAQASGATWEGRPVGSWGDIGCFSFFPTKNLGAAGDAGAVVTEDDNLANRMKYLAVHGMPKRYIHEELGYNSRLDAIQAAILNIKLPRLAKWIEKRIQIAGIYKNLLKDLPGIELPDHKEQEYGLHAWNQYVIRVSFQCKFNPEQLKIICSILGLEYNLSLNSGRDLLQEALRIRGINTIIYYPVPIHMQPAYKKIGYTNKHLPVTEKVCTEVLSLPIFPEISLDEQHYVAKMICEIVDKINNINL